MEWIPKDRIFTGKLLFYPRVHSTGRFTNLSAVTVRLLKKLSKQASLTAWVKIRAIVWYLICLHSSSTLCSQVWQAAEAWSADMHAAVYLHLRSNKYDNGGGIFLKHECTLWGIIFDIRYKLQKQTFNGSWSIWADLLWCKHPVWSVVLQIIWNQITISSNPPPLHEQLNLKLP